MDLIVTNTDTTDITFDLACWTKDFTQQNCRHGSFLYIKRYTYTSWFYFYLWDSDNILSSAGSSGTNISEYKDIKSKFELTDKNFTFLIRLDTGFIARCC